MAKVKEFDGNANVPAVIEDPRPGINALYFFGREVDKNTLAPKYDSYINFSYQGSTGTSAQYGVFNTNSFSNSPGPNYFSQSYRNGNFLCLSKGTVSVPAYITRPTSFSRSSAYYLDFASTACLDDSINFSTNCVALRNNSTNAVDGVALINNDALANIGYGRIWSNMSSTDRLHTVRPTGFFQPSNSARMWVLPKLLNDEYGLVVLASANSSNQDYPTDNWKVVYQYGVSSFSSVGESATLTGSYYKHQFIGYSTFNGNPLFIGNYNSSATPNFNIVRFNHNSTSTPSLTQLHAFTGNGTIGGTNAGGSSTISARTLLASHWYTDPRVGAGTRKVFYRPFYDSYNNYHPTVITWDQTNDTFAREDNVTITGDLSSVHSNITNIPDTNSANGADGFTINDTFVSGGTRYITLMHFQFQDILDEGCRTWVTYSVDPADPKALTYHSKTIIPVTPMNYYWLNDSRTLLAVLTGALTYIYSFNGNTGWTLATTISDKIVEIGRDSLDRIWYVTQSDKDGGSFFPSIHLLTPTLPVTVSIVPASSDYTYAGSPINTTLTLNAINASGSRIATNVKVVIEGASMTFSDGTTIKTISTSSTADTTVNVIITGAGYTNVTASIEI
jgi:hypothetical protein